MSDQSTGAFVVQENDIPLQSDPPDIRLQKLARITLDSMAQLVALLRPDGTVLDVNRAALEAAGIQLSDVEGKPFWATTWWQVSDAGRQTLEESVAQAAKGKSVRWDTEIHGGAGGREKVTVDASLRPVFDPQGNVIFICAEGRDITERNAEELARQAEELEAREEVMRAREQIDGLREAAESASRAKDEFLAMLGHELRNPLSPILTALQLIKLQGPERSERAYTIIERQVTHLTRLVDDLLDVSRIARGKVELKIDTVEISEVVAKAIEMASPLLEQRNHQLTVDVPKHGLAVNGDPVRLSQVVSNLLTNAAKYTPQRGGRITVLADQVGDEVVLRVIDTGIGIAPDVIPRVFDLFVQERQASDRSQGGLGLGLTIVRNLVERHGGSVSAKSAGPGRGSEFTVRLPKAERAGRVAPSSSSASSAGGQSRPRPQGVPILIVDDNTDGAEMLSLMLTHMGYDTRVAHNGPVALRIAQEFRPKLALLDIGLPVMDGYELGSRLREMPELAGILLIAVTGYGQDSDRQKTRAAGFHEHLVKPVTYEELGAAVSQMLSGPRANGVTDVRSSTPR